MFMKACKLSLNVRHAHEMDGVEPNTVCHGVLGLIEVNFEQLSCGFESDTCLWFMSGNSAWQFVAGSAYDGNWSLEAANSRSEERVLSLESTRFSATSRKPMILMFSYQINASSSATLELQAQPAAGSWRTIFQQTGENRGGLWRSETLTVPDSTIALRFTASVSAVEDFIRLDSLTPFLGLEAVSCGFERGACGWSGDGQPSQGAYTAAFRGCCVWAAIQAAATTTAAQARALQHVRAF